MCIMKKIIALVLTVILVFCSVSVAVFAKDDEVCPTIVVPGYSASYLYAVEDDGLRQIWGSFEGLNIGEVVLQNLARLGLGLGSAAFGCPEFLVDTLIGGLKEICGDLAYSPEGVPAVETVTYPNDPAITNYYYLINEKGSAHAAELEIMSDVADNYGEDGYKYLYSFQCDFRKNIVDVAEELKNYIDAVLEYTGKDKVNIYAVSYGGQISACYLNLYGHEGKVNNAVLTVPAIGGAALAYDALSGTIRFDEETLFYFIENGMMLEEDINWLMKAHSLGFLDKVLNMLIERGLRDLVGYWGSLWDFMPAEYYDVMKDKYLDAAVNAELIRKSDYFHYEILPSMSRKFNECLSDGTNIYIVAGSDNPSVTGMYVQSDGIIHLNGATGAECAPLELRFSDGYTGAYTTCKDRSHNHISPAMNIDASTCYIPEQTWFISGLFHGMTWKDDYVKNLCLTLLFSEHQINVRTYSEFPQFYYSTNVCHSVSAAFDKSLNGYLSSSDEKLLITNLSDKYNMNLMSVEVSGIDMDIKVPALTILQPGESIALDFSGNIPKNSFSTVDICVNYYLLGSITPRGCRELTFMLNNGAPCEYDSSEKYMLGKHSTNFDNATGDFVATILRFTGLFDYFKMIYNFFIGLFD